MRELIKTIEEYAKDVVHKASDDDNISTEEFAIIGLIIGVDLSIIGVGGSINTKLYEKVLTKEKEMIAELRSHLGIDSLRLIMGYREKVIALLDETSETQQQSS